MVLLDRIEHLRFLSVLNRYDYKLWVKINQVWTNPFLDSLLPFLREPATWIPLYLFLLLFITINFGYRGWWWSLSLIMTAIISDLTSSHFVKSIIFRYRPCQNPLTAAQARLLVNYCPHSSSFTSSHACNHFAVAMFVFMTLKQTSSAWCMLFLWAFAISYAQVYVGVHYPSDVICGGILGCGIGFTLSLFFQKQFGLS